METVLNFAERSPVPNHCCIFLKQWPPPSLLSVLMPVDLNMGQRIDYGGGRGLFHAFTDACGLYDYETGWFVFFSLYSVNRDRRSDILCAVSSPKLNMVLEVWPYQCHLQGTMTFSPCWLHYWFYLIGGTWEEMFWVCVGSFFTWGF